VNKAVEMKGIMKSFGTNDVLKGVDFSLEKGSIHALLGENGAGKSTLMNILGSLLTCDEGEIYIDGELVNLSRDAFFRKEKISFIHQELSLVNDLNIYENLFLGSELKNGLLLDRGRMEEKARLTLEKMGVDVSPLAKVSDLAPSYKQIIEIARAIMKESEIIIMDEPTTSLTDVEIEKVFAVMSTLKAQGISLIFISHKLNEVIQICDSYTIMRDGDIVAQGKVTNQTTEKVLSTHMVGKEVLSDDIYQSRAVGDVVLELRGLSKNREYRDINFNVKKGEIVGVTGLIGDGRTEVFASVIGANYPYAGEILVNGKVVKMRRTSLGKRTRIAYVPKNRKENGIVKDMSISENLNLSIMAKISKVGFIDQNAQKEIVSRYVDQLKIKVSNVNDLITSLSGGNQQKIVLSKALSSDPQVLILDNPTQGVDIGAKMEIYRQIMELASQGLSFVVLSSEISELQRICDRVYVMFSGEIKHEFLRDEIIEKDIMLVATGGTLKPANGGN